MANPILPGLTGAEQEVLYRKLWQYNEGRPSYKETGAYIVVLPRPGQGRTANLSLFSGTCKPRADFFRRGAAFFRRAPPEDAPPPFAVAKVLTPALSLQIFQALFSGKFTVPGTTRCITTV